jgi:hypothetical protein
MALQLFEDTGSSPDIHFELNQKKIVKVQATAILSQIHLPYIVINLSFKYYKIKRKVAAENILITTVGSNEKREAANKVRAMAIKSAGLLRTK